MISGTRLYARDQNNYYDLILVWEITNKGEGRAPMDNYYVGKAGGRVKGDSQGEAPGDNEGEAGGGAGGGGREIMGGEPIDARDVRTRKEGER